VGEGVQGGGRFDRVEEDAGDGSDSVFGADQHSRCRSDFISVRGIVQCHQQRLAQVVTGHNAQSAISNASARSTPPSGNYQATPHPATTRRQSAEVAFQHLREGCRLFHPSGFRIRLELPMELRHRRSEDCSHCRPASSPAGRSGASALPPMWAGSDAATLRW
jgi:hypothetical protein